MLSDGAETQLQSRKTSVRKNAETSRQGAETSSKVVETPLKTAARHSRSLRGTPLTVPLQGGPELCQRRQDEGKP